MSKNCNQCKHYFITFDQAAPKGCKAYGLKSKQMPSTIVRQVTNGSGCLGFELKDRLKKKPEKNLNDPSLW